LPLRPLAPPEAVPREQRPRPLRGRPLRSFLFLPGLLGGLALSDASIAGGHDSLPRALRRSVISGLSAIALAHSSWAFCPFLAAASRSARFRVFMASQFWLGCETAVENKKRNATLDELGIP